MNWYKIASHNIIIPESIENDILSIAKKVTNYYLKKLKTNVDLGKIIFINPYTKLEEKINIKIRPRDKKFNNVIAIFESGINTITIFPYHIGNYSDKDANKNANNIFYYYYSYIKHEIVHAIDPKLKQDLFNRNVKKNELLPYEEKPYEFDAISFQICDVIKRQYDNSFNKIGIINWLKNSLFLPEFLKPFEKFLNNWQKNRPDLFKKLKERIYNIIFNEDKKYDIPKYKK